MSGCGKIRKKILKQRKVVSKSREEKEQIRQRKL